MDDRHAYISIVDRLRISIETERALRDPRERLLTDSLDEILRLRAEIHHLNEALLDAKHEIKMARLTHLRDER